MPILKGIEACLNLVPYRKMQTDRFEFCLSPSVDTPSAALRYIESRTDDFFQIVIDARSFAEENPSIIYLKVWLMIDGVLYGDDSTYGSVGYVHAAAISTLPGFVKKKQGGGFEGRPFRFKDVIAGDDGVDVDKVGEITIMLGRCKDDGPFVRNRGMVGSKGGQGPVETVADGCIVDNDLSHTVGLGDAIDVRPGLLFCQLEKLDTMEKPFVSFTFRYRDRCKFSFPLRRLVRVLRLW